MIFLYIKYVFFYHFSSLEAAIFSIETLQKENAEQRAEILYLKEQIEWFKRQIFGQKSERVVDVNQEQLKFDGFEIVEQPSNETKIVLSHERKNSNCLCLLHHCSAR